MIDNCADCKTKCCSVGPGPHEPIHHEVFLLNYGENDNYNKKCDQFIDGKCNLWGTDRMPVDCQIFVCSVRSFTESELEHIRKVTGRV